MKLFLLAALCAGYAAAQSPGEPFFLVRIVQNDSGPGLDAGPIDVYRAARSPVDVVGLRSVTGPSQLWLLETHGSFTSIETLDNALASAARRRDNASLQDWLLARSSTLIGLYRPALSYRPDEAVKLFRFARYFRVSVYRIRPGFEIEFGELMRLRRSGLESINVDRPEIGYQVISGSASGTYVFLSPIASLSILDNGLAHLPAYAQETAHAAAGAARQATADALLSREQLLFRVEPGASFVSSEFAGSNASFWHPGSESRP